MSFHQCRNCPNKFEHSKRGRPPVLCAVCKGTSTQPVAPVIPPVVAPPKTLSVASEDNSEPSVETVAASSPTGAYEVDVSNMGSAYRGDDDKAAEKIYESFCEKSSAGFGQVGFEKVSFYHYVNENKVLVKDCHPRPIRKDIK